MSWPRPEPGLVIRYAYLWAREADAGQEEGTKDRPCAIVMVTQRDGYAPLVQVLPVTHSPPIDPTEAMEIPQPVKQRLGLDADRSWVVLTELNEFRWPGPDLRPQVIGRPETVAYGLLPPSFFNALRHRYLAIEAARSLQVTPRSE